MLPTIDLQGDDFILHVPESNRTLSVPATADGMKYLKEIIAGAKAHWATEARETRRGHINGFPTQHVIEQWKREDAKRKAEEAKENVEERFGIDLGKLEIKL